MTLDVEMPAPRRSRFLYPGFIASLAINLLFVGGIATAAWHHHMGSKTDEYGLMSFSRDLKPEHRDAFRARVLATRAEVKDLRSNLRQKWLEANALLTSEPFDKDKYKTALSELRDAESQYRNVLNNSLAEMAAGLSLEERKSLQAWRDKRRPKFLRHADPQNESGPQKPAESPAPAP